MIAPCIPSVSLRLQIELELLNTLFSHKDSENLNHLSYPWNPAASDAEACLSALEQAFSLDDWFAEDTTDRSQLFFRQLEQCWVTTELSSRFAAIPTALLDAIAARAKQVLEQSVGVAENLVGCVREIFPNWNEADLHVLARPFAYAMRDGSHLSTLATHTDWSTLSEIEQVRLSLAAAHYLLTQVPDEMQK